MASLSVYREELHDLPKQRGTRKKPSLCNWAVEISVDSRDDHLKNLRINLFQLGDRGDEE